LGDPRISQVIEIAKKIQQLKSLVYRSYTTEYFQKDLVNLQDQVSNNIGSQNKTISKINAERLNRYIGKVSLAEGKQLAFKTPLRIKDFSYRQPDVVSNLKVGKSKGNASGLGIKTKEPSREYDPTSNLSKYPEEQSNTLPTLPPDRTTRLTPKNQLYINLVKKRHLSNERVHTLHNLDDEQKNKPDPSNSAELAPLSDKIGFTYQDSQSLSRLRSKSGKSNVLQKHLPPIQDLKKSQSKPTITTSNLQVPAFNVKTRLETLCLQDDLSIDNPPPNKGTTSQIPAQPRTLIELMDKSRSPKGLITQVQVAKKPYISLGSLNPSKRPDLYNA
jgi:hypothetical protein